MDWWLAGPGGVGKRPCPQEEEEDVVCSGKQRWPITSGQPQHLALQQRKKEEEETPPRVGGDAAESEETPQRVRDAAESQETPQRVRRHRKSSTPIKKIRKEDRRRPSFWLPKIEDRRAAGRRCTGGFSATELFRDPAVAEGRRAKTRVQVYNKYKYLRKQF